jgi:hypothetical protein
MSMYPVNIQIGRALNSFYLNSDTVKYCGLTNTINNINGFDLAQIFRKFKLD